MAESKEELKSLLMGVKEDSEKAALKLNIQKTKILASSHITSWKTDRETVTDFIFLGSKITLDSDCSHENKRRLLLKSCDQPRQHIKKQRHHSANKGPYSQSGGFPAVIYGCESWTTEKQRAEELMLSNYGTGEDS